MGQMHVTKRAVHGHALSLPCCVQLTGVELDRSRPGSQLSHRLVFFGLGLSLNFPHQLNRISHLSISSQTGVQPCMSQKIECLQALGTE